MWRRRGTDRPIGVSEGRRLAARFRKLDAAGEWSLAIYKPVSLSLSLSLSLSVFASLAVGWIRNSGAPPRKDASREARANNRS